MSSEEVIINQLIGKRLSLATAESCTGGLISHRLTNVSGSSNVFLGGIVAYSNDVKRSLLGVSESILTELGAVCSDVAREMASGVCQRLNSDFGIGVTGIAGPTGGTSTKPVGLVYIAVVSQHLNICKVQECHFKGNRMEIKQQTADTALNLLIETIIALDER